LFTDARVDGLYGDGLAGSLQAAGYHVRRVVLPEGEQAKTLTHYARLAEHVLFEGIDERSVLISLGGGTVCNACGFLAATLYRGVGLIHVPTTLMAQCDAAISHKQGINGRRGKNLVGSYYAPMAIAIDVDVLATLEDWLISDGLAEVIKHAVGQDRGYLEFLLAYDGDRRDPEFLETVVRKNIELKCRLMASDPKEHREGMVLQLGHEVGHAVEFLSGYALNHGQSVAIGMMVSARVAHMMGGAAADVVDVQQTVLERYGLPYRVPADILVDDVVSSMRYNKRYLMEGNRMALVQDLGEMWSVDGEYAIPVTDQVLRDALRFSY
jgi:3-dehydroquinate synthase